MHKAECAAFRKAAPRRPPTAIRVLCRILWRKASDPPSYQAVEKLQSHRMEQTAERLETFAQMTILIRSLVGEDVCLDAEAMVKLLCQFSCNSISISDEELVNIGVGMFPTLALVNHSCSPNTAIIFNGSKATLRSIKPIAAGEEVLQSYTEIAEPRHIRQRELQQTYFFTCVCPVCSLGQRPDPRTTYICPRGPQACAGIVDLREHDVGGAVCSVHGALTADEQAWLENPLTEAHAKYDQAVQTREAAKDGQRALELGLLARALLAPITRGGNAARLRIDRLVLAMYLQKGDSAGAYPIACEMKEAFDELYEGEHPAKAVQAYLVFKLAEWAEPENRALLVQLGEAAVAAMGRSHGENCAMWKEAMEKLQPLRSGVPGAFA
ncbi:SET and MYND domain-containing protein 3 [Geranomyces variabilis]|uniref:SET and MYND domain-containing protein 3 n=1 Tax=Geranomyces variabilis TaxID=109894 RepID=A0AAD5XLW6_9FUNG|nr:SET and MYND domain-containing protein 3 [Geranomyces variabilis]